MSSEKPGFYSTLEMLRGLTPEHQQKLLKDVASKDPELATKLSENLFQFSDLSTVNIPALSAIIKAVDERVLALAMRQKNEKLEHALSSAMSARAAQMLNETIQGLGPQPLSKVQEAQQEIVQLALKLEAEGKIVLRASADDQMV